MATYSINMGKPYESTFLGNLDPNLFLNKIPNNTAQLIVPEDVRDSLYTIWDNVAFKQVASSGSSIEYIGIKGSVHTDNYDNGRDGLKLFVGKPDLSDVDIMNNNLISYNSSNVNFPDSDIIFYNFKPDDYGGGGSDQQFTKLSFLAGDPSNGLFNTAPYILSQENSGGTAINMTIYNEGGKLTIDSNDELIIGSPNTKITLQYGTGSTGIQTFPSGNPGDLQINLDNCEFGSINGSSASLGNVLIMGASNSPYWGTLSVENVFTLNQILISGNQTTGEDLILNTNDSIYLGGTGSTYGRILYDGNTSLISTGGDMTIDVDGTFRLEVSGIGANKALLTDSSGNAIWGDFISSSGNTGDLQISNGSGGLSNISGSTASNGDVLLMGNSNTPYWGSVSIGGGSSVGNNGDLQISNGSGGFSNIDGSTASVGDVLIMGSSIPYWGNSVGSGGVTYSLTQVLSQGNQSSGEDILITSGDSVRIGGISNNDSRIYYDDTFGVESTIFTSPSGNITIDTSGGGNFRLNINGHGNNKVLLTDGSGNAFWGNTLPDIATNTSNIATNSSNISSNSNAISELTAGVEFYKFVPSASIGMLVTIGGVYESDVSGFAHSTSEPSDERELLVGIDHIGNIYLKGRLRVLAGKLTPNTPVKVAYVSHHYYPDIKFVKDILLYQFRIFTTGQTTTFIDTADHTVRGGSIEFRTNGDIFVTLEDITYDTISTGNTSPYFHIFVDIMVPKVNGSIGTSF